MVHCGRGLCTSAPPTLYETSSAHSIGSVLQFARLRSVQAPVGDPSTPTPDDLDLDMQTREVTGSQLTSPIPEMGAADLTVAPQKAADGETLNPCAAETT